MALINCPECKNQISDKARVCPNCGSLVIKEKPKTICPECKKEISDKVKSCPSCGCPIRKKPNKKKIIIGVGVFFVLWLFVSEVSSNLTEPKPATTPTTSESVSKIIPDTSPKNGWTFYHGDKYISIDSTLQELYDAFGKDGVRDVFFSYESSFGKFMNDEIYSFYMKFPSDWHMLNGLDENSTETMVINMYSLKPEEGEENIYREIRTHLYKIYLKKNGEELIRCEESEAEFDMQISIKKEYLQYIALKKHGIRTDKFDFKPKLASETYPSILPDEYVDENISLFNGEIAISVDTRKKDLVKFLEKSSMSSSEEIYEGSEYFNIENIIISFKDDESTSLLTNKSDKWVTSKGIGVGSTQEEALVAYKITESDLVVNPDIPDKKDFIIYYKNVSSTETVECKSFEYDYRVSFKLENGYITSILITR